MSVTKLIKNKLLKDLIDFTVYSTQIMKEKKFSASFKYAILNWLAGRVAIPSLTPLAPMLLPHLLSYKTIFCLLFQLVWLAVKQSRTLGRLPGSLQYPKVKVGH